MDHTPEPWDCAKVDGVFYVYSPRMGLSVCKMTDVMTMGQFGNARRIVACVNAFEGYDLRQVELIAHNGGVTTFSFETVKAMEADRDRWKALAVEAGERLKDSGDYLGESLNNVLDDSRPKYERQRQLIREDMAKNNEVIAKIQEAGE